MSDLAPPPPPSPDESRPFPLLRLEVTQTLLVPPEYVRAYQAVDPQLARAVVEASLELQKEMTQAWIRNQERVRELEKEEMRQRHKFVAQDQKAEIDDRVRGRDFQGRGQWLAAGVTLGGFVLCGVALVLRMEAAAIALGCGMIAVLAGVFISGRLLREKRPNEPTPDAPPPPNDPS